MRGDIGWRMQNENICKRDIESYINCVNKYIF